MSGVAPPRFKPIPGLRADMIRYRAYYPLLVPAVTLFALFRYAPMAGAVVAFKDFRVLDGLFGSRWAGLKYFRQMFNTTYFYTVAFNTVKISLLHLCLGFPAPIVFALALNELRSVRAKRVFQSISYLPHFMSWVVAGVLIQELLSLRGPVNYVRFLLGLDPILFLQKETFFVPILIVTEIWKTVGWSSIIYLAAIAGIDHGLYEAAKIDGATRIQQIRVITLPSIKHVIVVLFLLRIGNILEAGFDQVFNLYNPLVYSVSDIIDTYVYRLGINQVRYSFAAAVSLAQNGVGLVLMLIVNRVTKALGEGEATVL